MPGEPAALRLVSIKELNQLARDQFELALTPLFESAPLVAAVLYEGRPYRSYTHLLDRADALVTALPEEQRVAVINAHPRIGENAELIRRISPASYHEQGYAAESVLDANELASVYRDLAELNRAYEEQFGFRFLVYVAGRPKAAIVEVLRERLRNTRSEEIATALHDLVLIARDRLRTSTETGSSGTVT